MKYIVLREHHGDREYRNGDMREAAPADVLHLVALGVLAERPEPARQAAPTTKAAKKAPESK